jgi:hypothetical protein
VTLDEVASNWGHPLKSPFDRSVAIAGMTGGEIGQEARPSILARPQKNGVGMTGRFVGQ